MTPARYPACRTPTVANVMISDGIRPTPAKTAAGRHAAAVIADTATNAVTRNHSPSSTPVAPAATKAHNMGSTFLLQHSPQETARARVTTWDMPISTIATKPYRRLTRELGTKPLTRMVVPRRLGSKPAGSGALNLRNCLPVGERVIEYWQNRGSVCRRTGNGNISKYSGRNVNEIARALRDFPDGPLAARRAQ